MIEAAAAALNGRLRGPFAGSALFVFGEDGAILLDAAGARAVAPGTQAGVTLSASTETFRDIFDGKMAPMSAYMSGRLQIRGDISLAMRLGSVLG